MTENRIKIRSKPMRDKVDRVKYNHTPELLPARMAFRNFLKASSGYNQRWGTLRNSCGISSTNGW